jgi:hypothetical protein
VPLHEFFQCGRDIESPASDSEFRACDYHEQATVVDRKRNRYASKARQPLEPRENPREESQLVGGSICVIP